ncbi:energy-coupling factor transport system ATP-binding protein [Motilibacter rhizosphaerae]|uniref:Energy-coupling factor transport system ATP-binding protein n=1 Tax=Motilibacter rhizosphaerae TaxID=598652 RepID=A0A4Q7NQ76_9ACTN|nr:ABC transporter ATP-binding protein [Motilibacter rhizosphaerae]RZS87238.1 energy-coupling factor transport system ATP-binding protein [Motilibacter rhizosphaerae]
MGQLGLAPAAAGLRPVEVRARGWGWRHAGRRAWAVRDVDLAVRAGERVLVVGRSGAGKSTLLAGVAGLLDPATAEESAGELLLDGTSARAARARAGLLQQDPQAGLVLARAGDDVAFGLESWGVPPDAIWPRVRAAVDAVGFRHPLDHPTAGLSGGEAQRLGLAGLLALRPGLVLLDEPTANLDPEGVADVRRAVGDVLEQSGATLLLVEHRPGPWLDLVDRVVVLGPTGVEADGPPDAVLAGERGRALAEDGVWVPGYEPVPAPLVPSPGAVVLEARGVGHRHRGAERDTPAPLDLELRAGEAVAVTGRNGAGKTTLGRALGGLLRPAYGPVVVPGEPEPLHRWRAARLARTVGSVFQRPAQQFLTGTVEDEVALAPRGTTTDPARVAELLERLRLAHLARANPHTLSGGEQRRLSVATVLARDPAVLVLDEPTFGQDARTWSELVALLQELLREGTSVAAVTHDRALVAALGAREVVLP